jgi:hypothetical protein
MLVYPSVTFLGDHQTMADLLTHLWTSKATAEAKRG